MACTPEPQRTAEGRPDEWDLDALWDDLAHVYPVSLTQAELVDAVGGRDNLTSERLASELTDDAAVAYEDAETRIDANPLARAQLGSEPMRTLERRVLLAVVDKRWREHLYEMDYLKEGIGLRAMAQRDPLVEYQKEGGEMFNAMNDGVKEETVRQLFMLRKQFKQQEEEQAGESAATASGNGEGTVEA